MISDNLIKLHIKKRNYKEIARIYCIELSKINKIKYDKKLLAVLENIVVDLIFNTRLVQIEKIRKMVKRI